jgi:hypothetical protein
MTDYHVSRNGRTLGVYPEADARDYYAQGRIGPADLVWREGMPAWLAASQVFGPAPFAAEPVAAPMPAAPAFTQVASTGASLADPAAVPPPPRLHWALVLLFTLLTFGIFYVVWMFVQAAWVRRIDPASNAVTLLVVYVVLVLLGEAIAGASQKDSNEAAVGGLLVLAGSVVSVVAMFSMRRSMVAYFTGVVPIALRLSGALTFFVGVFYLQYHMTRISRWKASGVLPLQ